MLTHLHTDHAGGLEHFPRAEILVSQREYRGAVGLAGQVRGYLPHRWPKWFKPRFIEFQTNADCAPFERCAPLTADGAVMIVPTAGHTPGHVSVIVRDEGAHYFLAGDTTYTQDATPQPPGRRREPRRGHGTADDPDHSRLCQTESHGLPPCARPGIASPIAGSFDSLNC